MFAALLTVYEVACFLGRGLLLLYFSVGVNQPLQFEDDDVRARLAWWIIAKSDAMTFFAV